MATEETFSGWAILELMGHRRLAGHVQEVEIAGHGMLRLDIPEVGDFPAATQFYSPGAIYAITPTTEETARLVQARPAPIQQWEIPRLLEAASPHTPAPWDEIDENDPLEGADYGDSDGLISDDDTIEIDAQEVTG